MQIDSTGYVGLGDVCRDILGMQCQYGSRYADPYYASQEAVAKGERTPFLAEGLDITGKPGDYHFMRIHRDSVERFVSRVIEHKVTNFVWTKDQGAAANARLQAAFAKITREKC